MTIHGSTSFAALGYTLVSTAPSSDPVNGIGVTETYTGTPAAIAALASSVQDRGARTTISNPDGGFSTLTVVWARDPNAADSAEVPFDQWSLNGEPYQISIFAHPDARRESDRLGENGQASYKQQIEDAVRDGNDNPLSDEYPVAKALYRLLSAGTEYWETTRPSLTRTRTYSNSFTGTRLQISASQTVYTRSSLVSQFAVPSSTQVQIPSDPGEAPPAGTVWGWRLKSQSYQFTRERNGTKVEERLEWDFAAWSTALYAVV